MEGLASLARYIILKLSSKNNEMATVADPAARSPLPCLGSFREVEKQDAEN